MQMQQEQPVEWRTFKRTGCLGWFKSVPKAKTWAPHLPGVRWMVEPARAAACSVTRRGRRWLKNKSGPCSFLQIKMYWTNCAHSCFTPFLGCSAVRTRRAESRSCDTDPMACKAQKISLWPFIGVCQPLAETVAAEASGKGLSERVFARSPSTRRSGSLTTVLRRDLSSALHLHPSSDGVLTPPARAVLLLNHPSAGVGSRASVSSAVGPSGRPPSLPGHRPAVVRSSTPSLHSSSVC